MTPPPAPNTFPQWKPKDFFHFEIIHQSKKSRARVGRIHTPHGHIDTPGFVAVGTNGALKCVSLAQADTLGLQLMFCNTYHLLVNAGVDTISRAGGLHKYIGRDKPLITDSGGFQIFSLAYGGVHKELNRSVANKLYKDNQPPIKITEEGAQFRSYRNGDKLVLTPESSVEAQKVFGADIIIPLDELPAYHISREELEKSVYLSHRWMARSLNTHLKDVKKQAMYAVVHGGIDRELRKLSIDYLSQLPFDGYCVGGSLGKNREELIELLDFVMPQLPNDKPNHLLGIADLESIYQSVTKGVDTFDSAFPTRIGRHGTLLTNDGRGRVNIRSGKWNDVFTSSHPEININLESVGMGSISLSYLRHLMKANEPISSTIMTLHNLQVMFDTMQDIRNKILNDEI